MRRIPVTAALLLITISMLALGCAGGVDPGWTTTTTVTTTPPAGQSSTAVKTQLDAVLDDLIDDGIFDGHRVVLSYTSSVNDQEVEVEITLRNSTDDEYADINQSMRDIIENCSVLVAGYFGPNDDMGDAYGSRTVQVDISLYAAQIARYYYEPQSAGGAGGDKWSIVIYYADPESYSTYALPERLRIYGIYNNTSLCDSFDGVTFYLNATDIDGNPTWELGSYNLKVFTMDNETALENDYAISNAFLEYPGTTYGIYIDESVFDAPKDQLSWVLVSHTRAIDGKELTAWTYIFDAINYCEE